MIFRRLSEKELGEVYESYLKKDFAADEVKPFSAIMDMYDRGEYEAYGFFEDNMLLAYAYFVTPKSSDTVLLDYFAVAGEKRGSGIGSSAVQIMGENINKSIVLEIEHPAFYKDQDDLLTRNRRIRFYERNGLLLSKVHTRLFGVDFLIMQFEKTAVSDEILRQKIADIYKCMFNKINTSKVTIFDLEADNA
ncbi:MAG: GNAT family N-acetyltransferase [Clostridia bacterium]|nr:GNAT family N-acetyltransferase [Clostridia bacterium]